MIRITALFVLFLGFFINGFAQNVNSVVDKNDIQEDLLFSLIIERVNEIRSFKQLDELSSNEICRLAALDQANFNSLNLKSTTERVEEGVETTYDRAVMYGCGKKGKLTENVYDIEITPSFTYIDLSDEIVSSWLLDKESSKSIEGKKSTVYGLGISLEPNSGVLYVSLVIGDDGVGNQVIYPSKEEEVTDKEDEVAQKEEPKEELKEETKEDPKEESVEVVAEEPKEESTQTVTEEPKDEVVSVSQEEQSPIEERSDLPACVSEDKDKILNTTAELGVFYSDSNIYIRKKYLKQLTNVVTSDMDGLSLLITQLEPYKLGPNNFNYELLNVEKIYKANLFADLESDFFVMKMPSTVKDNYAFDLQYIRKGMPCIDKLVSIREADFDESEFLAASSGTSLEDLEVLFDVRSKVVQAEKEGRQVKFILSFNRGRANYNEKSMKLIIDKLVDPGYTISAAIVTAHTSVEGNVDLNKNLAKSRARNIVNALRDINGGDMFYGEVKTNDSWDHFYEKTKGTEFEKFKDMPKAEVGMMITRTPSLFQQLDPILKQERYADVEVYLEYESQEAVAEPEFKEINNIYYNFGSWYVRKDAAKSLDKFSGVLKKEQSVKLIEIGSHTDSRGSYAFNEKLSQKRAESVVKYLTSKGVDKERLIAKGYGEGQILNHCKDGIECTELEHQRNRRTTFRILMNDSEFNSVEPDDILVDYSPSNIPDMGFIDLAKEFKLLLQNENIEGALRVQRQIIKKVESGQLSPNLLLKDTLPSDASYAPLLNNQLVARVKYDEQYDKAETAGHFKSLMKQSKGNAFVVYNNLILQLKTNQSLLGQISSNEEKKGKLLNIIESLYKTKLPKTNLDDLKTAVMNL